MQLILFGSETGNRHACSCGRTYRAYSTAKTTPSDAFSALSRAPTARLSRQGGNGRVPVLCLDTGAASRGGCWTHNFSAAPNDAKECLLSQVLESETPAKYCLSARACRGILLRAQRRGKVLPPILRAASAHIANQG